MINFLSRSGSGVIITLLLSMCIILKPVDAFARSFNFIRDAEIEETIHKIADPIFEAALLPRDSVRILIVNDDSINAFVAGGSNIFINTGLLLESNDPLVLAGVLAHETGHITGGHLAKGAEQLNNLGIQSIIATVLTAAAAAGGQGAAAGAIASAGRQIAERNFLSFSRTQEESADQAGLSYLKAANIPADGLLKLLETLRRQETMAFGSQTEYMRTHPLSRDRISHIREFIESENIKGKLPKEKEIAYLRLVAKLRGFLHNPQKTRIFYEGKNSDDAILARSIVAFKTSQLEEALRNIDYLINKNPKDAYYHELKGQFLFENGKIEDSIISYFKAHSLKPEEPLISIGYAASLIASDKRERLDKAIKLLKDASLEEPRNPTIFDLLAKANMKLGNKNESNLNLAEKLLITGKYEEAIRVSSLITRVAEKSSAIYLKAEEINSEAKRLKKRKDDSK